MNLVVVLVAAGIVNLGSVFKNFAETNRFSMQINPETVKVEVVENNNHVRAVIRLLYKETKRDALTADIVSHEDYDVEAECGKNRVKIYSIKVNSKEKIITEEIIDDYLPAQTFSKNGLTVVDKFYEISCEIKREKFKKYVQIVL